MLGLVLSGGGARGAYEAGALRFLLTELPRRYGVDPLPRVICGTSIGALTGAWIAALGSQGAMRVSRIWQEMLPDHVYRFGARDLVRVPDMLIQRARVAAPAEALFDPAPVRDLIHRQLPWDLVHANVDSGRIHAFSVTATDVAAGTAIAFVDGPAARECTPTTCLVPARVGPDHCLASAAIPIVFPAVKLGESWYVDGGLRQNTPILPAIRMGASRVLVIGVKRAKQGPGAAPTMYAPTPAYLAGKALNALMLDPVEEDLRRLEMINEILEYAERRMPGFVEDLSRDVRPYRVVRSFHLQPTADIGAMAADTFRAYGHRLPLATRLLLRSIAANESAEEADLVSYLYFHRDFTGEVEALGFSDAEAREEELAALFGGV